MTHVSASDSWWVWVRKDNTLLNYENEEKGIVTAPLRGPQVNNGAGKHSSQPTTAPPLLLYHTRPLGASMEPFICPFVKIKQKERDRGHNHHTCSNSHHNNQDYRRIKGK